MVGGNDTDDDPGPLPTPADEGDGSGAAGGSGEARVGGSPFMGRRAWWGARRRAFLGPESTFNPKA